MTTSSVGFTAQSISKPTFAQLDARLWIASRLKPPNLPYASKDLIVRALGP